MKKTPLILCVSLLLYLFFLALLPAVQGASQIQASGAGLASKVAPGEFLPVSVKLLNFGSEDEVDVIVSYKIVAAAGRQIYSSEETVAVRTTANFIRTIQIPFDTIPGRYITRTSITYKDQLTPATTEFPFVVERKLIGVFESELFIYGGILLFISVIVGAVTHIWAKYRRSNRLNSIDYSSIPRSERVFYELISDTVAHMRQHAGDAALDAAKGIPGLEIDGITGKVLAVGKSPAKVMGLLVEQYEKLSGRKLSFALRKSGGGNRSDPADGSLVIIKKDVQ